MKDAQNAIDARNARYRTVATKYSQKNRKELVEVDSRELGNRLGAAEKAVEKFVAKRIQPAVQKVHLYSDLFYTALHCIARRVNC